MVKLLLLALGGAIGTLARYGFNGLVSHHQSKHLPWAVVFPLGTVLVNVSGCFVIGFCGGFTTFSSYGLQTLNLARDSEWLWVALNIIGSNVLCLLAVYLGRVCALWLQKT